MTSKNRQEAEGKETGGGGGTKQTGRILFLIMLLIVVLTVGWTVKPIRERIWNWVKVTYFGRPPRDE